MRKGYAMTGPVTGKIDAAQGASQLSGWAAEADALTRTYRFRDFGSAFAFMTRVAIHAEAANHHPEWSNVWNRVDVRLTTHDAGGVTQKDIDLARFMDEAAKGLPTA